MARKLAEIGEDVRSREEDFYQYLLGSIDTNVSNFFKSLTERTNVYLFSGVIRNYFLNVNLIRDLDIVVYSDTEIVDIISELNHRKNSFGGYKIHIGDMDVDLWSMPKTWSLNYHQRPLDFELERYIPHTAFFNFSSIMYSLNSKEFLFTKHFLSFLRDKEIDIVNEPNANYQLCLINSFYYSDRYRLKISDKLMDFIYRVYERENRDYSTIQEKHFGKILYQNEELERRILALSI